MLPAGFQKISAMSGFALATSFLLPLGLLIAAFGVYLLAAMRVGRLAGITCLIVMACCTSLAVFVPSGWFNFYWLFLIAPGTGFALGVCALWQLLPLFIWSSSSPKHLYFLMFLLCCLPLIRIHMFLLLAPTIIATLILHHYRTHARALWCFFLVFVWLVLYYSDLSDTLHSIWLSHFKPDEYLQLAIGMSSFLGVPLALPHLY
jgi:hypothetical protein